MYIEDFFVLLYAILFPLKKPRGSLEVGNLTLFEAQTVGAFDRVNDQNSREFGQILLILLEKPNLKTCAVTAKSKPLAPYVIRYFQLRTLASLRESLCRSVVFLIQVTEYIRCDILIFQLKEFRFVCYTIKQGVSWSTNEGKAIVC